MELLGKPIHFPGEPTCVGPEAGVLQRYAAPNTSKSGFYLQRQLFSYVLARDDSCRKIPAVGRD